jgi:hypothetical protein
MEEFAWGGFGEEMYWEMLLRLQLAQTKDFMVCGKPDQLGEIFQL